MLGFKSNGGMVEWRRDVVQQSGVASYAKKGELVVCCKPRMVQTAKRLAQVGNNFYAF